MPLLLHLYPWSLPLQLYATHKIYLTIPYVYVKDHGENIKIYEAQCLHSRSLQLSEREREDTG